MTIIITIIIHLIKTNNKKIQLQKQLIGTNGQPLAESIGQQHHLVGKWLMADRYIVLCLKGMLKFLNFAEILMFFTQMVTSLRFFPNLLQTDYAPELTYHNTVRKSWLFLYWMIA